MQKKSSNVHYKIIFIGTGYYGVIRSFMEKDYSEPEELLTDESFLAWYFQSPRQPGDPWERWMMEEPGREELARQAIALLESTVLREKGLPAGQLEQAEATLM